MHSQRVFGFAVALNRLGLIRANSEGEVAKFPSTFAVAAKNEVLQLREELMEGAAQPTWIVGLRPCRGGAMEGARDGVLDGAYGSSYYRVAAIS